MKNLRLLVLFTMLAAMVMAMPVMVNAASIGVNKEVTDPFHNEFHPGDVISYNITVSNPSTFFNLDVNSVIDTPPTGAPVVLTSPGTHYILPPSGSHTYPVFNYTVPLDANCGDIVNTINAKGTQLSSPPDQASGFAQKTSLIIKPKIQVLKTVTPTTSKAGDVVTFTIKVCNMGCVDVNLVNISDPCLGGDLPGFGDLAVGECSPSLKFPYTVKASDSDPLVNTVTANYVDTTGLAVSDTNSASVDLVHPCLSVTKSCLNGPVPPHGSAIFRVAIHNCGDVALNVSTTEPKIPPFTLAAGDTNQQDIVIEVNDVDVFNTITVQATLPIELGLDNVIGPYEANATCPVGVPPGGATRTLGFWKTHCEYTEHVLMTHCLGGTLDLGWIKVTNINDLLGVLFANPAKASDGSSRDTLCQARVITSKQAVAALLNNCLSNGATLPKTPAQIAAILGGTNVTDIRNLGSLLDTYNNSGDGIAIIDSDGFLFGNATPKNCAAIARIAAADCTAPVGVAPAAPTSLSVTAVKANGNKDTATLTWVNPAGNNQTSYSIQRATNAGFTAGLNTTTAAGTATTLNQTVQRGATCYYRIRAVNAVGASAWTNATQFPIVTP